MRELGRRGGLASAAARRKRRDRAWFDDWLDDLEAVAREVRATGNGLARVRMTEIAVEQKRERLAEREAALEERDRRLTQAERELVDMERSREEFEAWEAEAQAKCDARQAELEELERARDELRATIEREADEAGMEVFDDAAV
jgi:chromosome segregation ATPase